MNQLMPIELTKGITNSVKPAFVTDSLSVENIFHRQLWIVLSINH